MTGEDPCKKFRAVCRKDAGVSTMCSRSFRSRGRTLCGRTHTRRGKTETRLPRVLTSSEPQASHRERRSRSSLPRLPVSAPPPTTHPRGQKDTADSGCRKKDRLCGVATHGVGDLSGNLPGFVLGVPERFRRSATEIVRVLGVIHGASPLSGASPVEDRSVK